VLTSTERLPWGCHSRALIGFTPENSFLRPSLLSVAQTKVVPAIPLSDVKLAIVAPSFVRGPAVMSVSFNGCDYHTPPGVSSDEALVRAEAKHQSDDIVDWLGTHVWLKPTASSKRTSSVATVQHVSQATLMSGVQLPVRACVCAHVHAGVGYAPLCLSFCCSHLTSVALLRACRRCGYHAVRARSPNFEPCPYVVATPSTTASLCSPFSLPWGLAKVALWWWPEAGWTWSGGSRMRCLMPWACHSPNHAHSLPRRVMTTPAAAPHVDRPRHRAHRACSAQGPVPGPVPGPWVQAPRQPPLEVRCEAVPRQMKMRCAGGWTTSNFGASLSSCGCKPTFACV